MPKKIYRIEVTQTIYVSAESAELARKTLNQCDWGEPEREVRIWPVGDIREVAPKDRDQIPLDLDLADERTIRARL